MKYNFLLVALSAVILTSCSTAYRGGQTPDDVYYSPTREAGGIAKTDESNRYDKYETYTSSEDDNYLRMRIRNRNRWRTIDDFDYWYNPNYASSFGYSPYGSFTPYNLNNQLYFNYGYPSWNTWGYNNFGPQYYNSWNFHPSPYNSYRPIGGYYGGIYTNAPNVIIKNPVKASTSVARPTLNSYRNNEYNNSNNNRRTLGETLNKVFSPNNSGYNNSNNSVYSNRNSSSNSTYEAPSRSYTPPASSNSSSSSSSGATQSSGGSVRPPR